MALAHQISLHKHNMYRTRTSLDYKTILLTGTRVFCIVFYRKKKCYIHGHHHHSVISGGCRRRTAHHTNKNKYQNIIKHNGLVSFDFFNDSRARKENHSRSIHQTCVCALNMCSTHPHATQCRVASYLTVAFYSNAADGNARSPRREIHSCDCGRNLYAEAIWLRRAA